jgi:CHAT domain-containing protein
MYSHVLLAPSSSGAGEDGELQAWEIARLQLSARLVVLSGCETARGRVAPGEGVIGLTWAFFVAGASTAVVSQWAVDSATTSKLMVAFHRRVSGTDGRSIVSPARAMQQAAIPLLRSSRSRHPFYWAAFVVVGDGF